MRTVLRSSLDTGLRRSPAQVWFRRRAADRLAVLAYHGVDDPDTFARHLDYVLRVAAPVSLDTVLDAVAGQVELPRRSVLITFDDGERSVLEAGLPLLRARGVPAVAFVCPGLLDTDRPHWWTEVGYLLAAGGRAADVPRGVAEGRPDGWVRWLKTVEDARRLEVLTQLRRTAQTPAPPCPQLRSTDLATLEAGRVAVENHTLSHPCLDRCTDVEVRRQIRDAHEQLTRALGRPPRAFAYPNGNWDARAERELAELGYRLGMLFDHRLGVAGGQHPLRVSRLRVGSTTPLDRFATILSGLHPAVHHGRGLS